MIAENTSSTVEVQARILENMVLARRRATAAWFRINRAYPLDDLIGYACVGLCKAAQRFDPSRAKFSTYAVQQIDWAISDGMRDMDHLSRTQRTAARTEDNPAFRQISLYRTIQTPDGTVVCVADTLADPRADDPSHVAHRNTALSFLLDHLVEPHRGMFVARHLHHLTNAQVAHRYNVSAATISQINTRSLRYLRALAHKHAILCTLKEQPA